MVYQSDSRVWSCLRFWYLRCAHTHTYVKNMSGCEIAVVRTHQAACELQLGAGTDSHSDLYVLKCHLTDISWTCLDLFTLSEWFTHPRTSIYCIVHSLCSCELPSGYKMPCSFNVCVCSCFKSQDIIVCDSVYFVHEYVCASVWSSTKHLKGKLYACSYIDISAGRYQTVCW